MFISKKVRPCINDFMPRWSLESNIKMFELFNLICRLILQANMWDTEKEKLPKRKKPDDISVWNYKTEFGISRERMIDILYRGLTHRCAQLLAISDSKTVTKRRLIENHTLNTNFVFKKRPVYLTSRSNYLVTSDQPLKRFASINEVRQTANDAPDLPMYPISPLVDLVYSNLYKTESQIDYSSGYTDSNHHTLFLTYSSDWPMELRHANALLMSYAHCIEMAQHQGADTSLITDPICIQTVHSDGVSFGYTCFQLNTLGASSEATKTRHNMAWVDNDILFHKTVPRRSMLRDTTYSNYNPDVFRKVLGLFGRC